MVGPLRLPSPARGGGRNAARTRQKSRILLSKTNLSPLARAALYSGRLAQSRASSIAAFEGGARCGGPHIDRRVGAPGGAGLSRQRARAPRDPHPLKHLGPGILARDTGLARPVKGAAPAPWRLPALQPLIRGETEKRDTGTPAARKIKAPGSAALAMRRWLFEN